MIKKFIKKLNQLKKNKDFVKQYDLNNCFETLSEEINYLHQVRNRQKLEIMILQGHIRDLESKVMYKKKWKKTK